MYYAKYPNLSVRHDKDHFKSDAIDLALRIRPEWKGATMATKVLDKLKLACNINSIPTRYVQI